MKALSRLKTVGLSTAVILATVGSSEIVHAQGNTGGGKGLVGEWKTIAVPAAIPVNRTGTYDISADTINRNVSLDQEIQRSISWGHVPQTGGSGVYGARFSRFSGDRVHRVRMIRMWPYAGSRPGITREPQPSSCPLLRM